MGRIEDLSGDRSSLAAGDASQITGATQGGVIFSGGSDMGRFATR